MDRAPLCFAAAPLHDHFESAMAKEEMMSPGLARPSLDDWRHELSEALKDPLNGASRSGDLSLLRPPGEVADDAMKLLIRDAEGRSVAVALCSPRFDPEAVAKGFRKAESARQALEADLSAHVVEPLHQGRLDGLSYAVLPFYGALSDSRIVRKLQRTAMVPRLFDWLRGVARATMTERDSDEANREIAEGLESLSKTEAMPAPVLEAAKTALRRLENGAWRPRRILSHGDFWVGNIMLASPEASRWPFGKRLDRFVVIDWGTSRVDGIAFDDLIRIGRSLGASPRRIGAEVAAHAQLLDCELDDARSYLAASLGILGLSLNQFPFENYVALARYSMNTMNEALAAAG